MTVLLAVPGMAALFMVLHMVFSSFRMMSFAPDLLCRKGRRVGWNGIGRLGRGIQFCRRRRGTGSRECRTIGELEGCGAAAPEKRPQSFRSVAAAWQLRSG